MKKFEKGVDKTDGVGYNQSCSAGIAHLVERHLAKVEVASSSLVARSSVVVSFIACDDFFVLTEKRKKAPPALRQGVCVFIGPLSA